MLNIDTHLKKAKLSKQDLAQKMNLTRESLWRILTGNPTLKNIEKMAEALNVEAWELLTTSGNNQGLIEGFIEYQGVIYRIKSVGDLEKVLNLAKGLN